MQKLLIHFLLLLGLFAGLTVSLIAQQPCQPPALKVSKRPNIFDEAQESDLGDAIAEQIQHEYKIIDDDDIAAHLKEIGNRLVKHLPPNNMRFQFFLVDLPTGNAFELPGGRIYISRKLIAFARNEDEIAGVIAHEIGHSISRQGSLDHTFLFKEVLKVTSVGDRKDIFAKYNLLYDNYLRHPEALIKLSKEREHDQIDADQIGVFALAAAGYDPQAIVAFWDRFAETKGNKGNFFSDWFGTTSPESRRLHEMIKNVGVLPASCVEARKAVTTAEFEAWKSSVVNYIGPGRKESLHGLISKTMLEPALRSVTGHIQFSPDGKYVLAQDDSGINVLTRDPFAVKFRIDAESANPAQFSLDSQRIVFQTEGVRVQIWDINDQRLITAKDVLVRVPCLQTSLSPDGKQLACLNANGDMQIYDPATGNQLFEKKRFYYAGSYTVKFAQMVVRGKMGEAGDQLHIMNMGYSPDGRYFIAATPAYNAFVLSNAETVLLLDMKTMTSIQLKGPVSKWIAAGFTFINAEELIAVNQKDPTKSIVVALPSGNIRHEIDLPSSDVAASSQADYLFMRPYKGKALGVMRLSDKAIITTSVTAAIDAYNKTFVIERKDGELALINEKEQVLATAEMPRKTLVSSVAMALSSDFGWLALAEASRGAVWDLTKGQRIFYGRGFNAAYFGGDGKLYADFPKSGGQPRSMVKMNLARTQEFEADPVDEEGKRVFQYGPYVLVEKPQEKNNYYKNVIIEFHDSRTMDLLWTRTFPKEVPWHVISARDGTMVIVWDVEEDEAKEALKNDPKLAQQLSGMKDRKWNFLLQVFDLKTGKLTGSVIVDTGKWSVKIDSAFSAGDWLIVADAENRVLPYSLSTGQRKGEAFGKYATVNTARGLLCVENENGQVTIYDLASMEKRDQFTFASPIVMMRFSEDGRKLFVLTRNQATYLLDISGLKQ